MMVVGLASGAPAEQAGVLPGDIILEVDGLPAGLDRTAERCAAICMKNGAVEIRRRGPEIRPRSPNFLPHCRRAVPFPHNHCVHLSIGFAGAKL